jgi:hypothetical protein
MPVKEDGTIAPIPVVLHGINGDVQQRLLPTPKVRNDKVTVNGSYLLTVGATPSNILPHAPKRNIAQIIVNGSTGSLVAFGGSQSDVEGAQVNGVGQIQGDVTYVAGSAIIPLGGNTPQWCALIAAGTGATIVSVFSEFDT